MFFFSVSLNVFVSFLFANNWISLSALLLSQESYMSRDARNWSSGFPTMSDTKLSSLSSYRRWIEA